MLLRVKRNCPGRGFSLIEVVIAAVVLTVMVLGTAGYRYYAVLDLRRATMQVTAARVSQLLCESWRGVKGSGSFAPAAQFGSAMSIAEVTAGPPTPEDFTLLGKYKVIANDFGCYTTLSWKDDSSGLRILNVATAWPRRGGTGEFETDLNSAADEYNFLDLTIYVVK